MALGTRLNQLMFYSHHRFETAVHLTLLCLVEQKTSFLKAVDVELTYSHSEVANVEDEFLPVGKTIQFTTEYGLLLRNHNEPKSQPNWQAMNKSNDVSIERSRKDQLKFSFSVKLFDFSE